MPRKVSRDERKNSNKQLSRPRKRQTPSKPKSDEITSSSASAKKMKFSTQTKVPEDAEKHYRIIDFLLVFASIATLVKCATCGGSISFKTCDKIGLGFKIQVKCEKCKEPKYIPSSEKVGAKYEINVRFVFVMRILGLGSAGCDKFCGLMDLASNFLN